MECGRIYGLRVRIKDNGKNNGRSKCKQNMEHEMDTGISQGVGASKLGRHIMKYMCEL